MARTKFVSWTTVIALVWVLALLLLAMAIVLSFSVDTGGSSSKTADREGRRDGIPKYALMVCARDARLAELWPLQETRWTALNFIPVLVYIGPHLETLPTSPYVHRVESIPGLSDHEVARYLWPLYATRLPGDTLLTDISRVPVRLPPLEADDRHIHVQEASPEQRQAREQPQRYAMASQHVWQKVLRTEQTTLSHLKHKARNMARQDRGPRHNFHEQCVAWGHVKDMPKVEDECALTVVAESTRSP